MNVVMAVVGLASAISLVARRPRSVGAEWVPGLLMSATMIAMAVSLAPVYCAALFLACALLYAARRRGAVADPHRGLAAVAMAALAMTHLVHAGGASQAVHAHGWGSWMLVAATVGCVGLSIGASFRALVVAPAGIAAAHRGAARLHRADIALMAAGTVAMAVPMA